MTHGAVPGSQPEYQPQRPTNGLAIAALVCSLAGPITGVSFLVGAILGHVALKQLRARGERGAGFATAGIIIGWIGTATLVLLLMLFVQALDEVG